MTRSTTPFYERTLDSFADHVICHVRQNKDGYWRAILDCGLSSGPGDPDFASHGYGASAELAAQNCATAIRQDARGIGKFAPRRILTPGYDLHFKLMRHWDKKERFEALGHDPNVMVSKALKANEHDEWKMSSGDLIGLWNSTRIMEFEFQLLMAEALHELRETGADPEEQREIVISGVRHAAQENVRGCAMTDETWERVGNRTDAMLAEALDHRPSPM